MRNSQIRPVILAVSSATLFGIGTPFAKLLIENIDPVVLAGLLYLGAFLGLTIYYGASRMALRRRNSGSPLDCKDAPWLAGATLSGGVVAPICLMSGLALTTGFTASLLLNLEGLATAVIAYIFFKENLGWRLGLAIVSMTIAGVILSWDPSTGVVSVAGPLLLLAAGVGWGVDNNLTRHISLKNPVQIAQVKGAVAGTASIVIALVLGYHVRIDNGTVFALVLGFVSYGASLVLFVQALQGMGASRTGAFYSLGPFVGAFVSILILSESLQWTMLPAAALMLVGVLAIVYERHTHAHVHEELTHSHPHSHDDTVHDHSHKAAVDGQHQHEHTHYAMSHDHVHWPDVHHRHGHEEQD